VGGANDGMADRPQMRHEVETYEHVVLHDDDTVVAHGAAVSSCLSCATFSPKSAEHPNVSGQRKAPSYSMRPSAVRCELDSLEACLGDVHCLGAVRQRRVGARGEQDRHGRFAKQIASLGKPRLCGAGGGTRTPTGIAALRIFVPATAFAALVSRLGTGRRVCGLDYPFTVPRTGEHPPEGRCCPSSLYTFPSRRPRRGRLFGL